MLHTDKDLRQLVKEAFDFAIHLEHNFPGQDPPALINEKDVCWAQTIAQSQQYIARVDQWDEFLERAVRPGLASVLSALTASGKHQDWGNKYNSAMNVLIQRFTWLLEANAHPSALRLAKLVDAAWPSVESLPLLSQKALLLARSSNASDCVLLGMRQEEYVREAMLNVAHRAPLPEAAHEEPYRMLAEGLAQEAPHKPAPHDDRAAPP